MYGQYERVWICTPLLAWGEKVSAAQLTRTVAGRQTHNSENQKRYIVESLQFVSEDYYYNARGSLTSIRYNGVPYKRQGTSLLSQGASENTAMHILFSIGPNVRTPNDVSAEVTVPNECVSEQSMSGFIWGCPPAAAIIDLSCGNCDGGKRHRTSNFRLGFWVVIHWNKYYQTHCVFLAPSWWC